ncbi:MAG: ABC transporter permease [bacterium]|nr:MAG: ABC transporter permease [bacterium]
MLSLKLAWRNLIGAGLRTWLNVIVLSISFVVIIWHRGMLDGWHEQARRDTIEWEIGGGQYWQKNYDPYDAFTLVDSHEKLSADIQEGVMSNILTPILISQATIYPQGRIQSVLLKGIDPTQKILNLPAKKLATESYEIPVLMGTRMAESTKLTIGDIVTIRWRDVNGTFDAAEAKIVDLFRTNVPKIDNGQLWIPLDRLRQMMQMPDEATIIVTNPEKKNLPQLSGWTFRDQQYLLSDIDRTIKQKQVGGSIIYIILLFLAMLAIFDTQVLSIFRRQREIGTQIALGMTRGQVIRLFTLEGSMHSILAAAVAAIYGIPLLLLQVKYGITMPENTDEYGMAIAEKIFPVYSLGLVITTTIVIFITATIVSFIPARKISRMKPTDAIRGKIN